MAGFSADFSGLHQLTSDLNKMAQGIKRKEAVTVKLTANEYKSDVQAIIPYKHGVLRKSVHVEPSEEGGHSTCLVGTDVIYAKQREYGGVIAAKNGGWLHWKSDDGVDHFARSVYQAPQPAWRPAFEMNKTKYDRMIKGVFNREEWERSGDAGSFGSDFGDTVKSEESPVRSSSDNDDYKLASFTIKGMFGTNEGTKGWKPYSEKGKGERI